MGRWRYADAPLPKTAAETAERDASWAAWLAEENARIAAQREHLGRLRLRGGVGMIRAMLERAETLLMEGEAEAADALLEFVPEAEAEALLRRLFDD